MAAKRNCKRLILFIGKEGRAFTRAAKCKGARHQRIVRASGGGATSCAASPTACSYPSHTSIPATRHVARCTSHVTRHTSHVTRHTPHVASGQQKNRSASDAVQGIDLMRQLQRCHTARSHTSRRAAKAHLFELVLVITVLLDQHNAVAVSAPPSSVLKRVEAH